MGRKSTLPTIITIRQVHAQSGKPYCVAGVPTELMTQLGWKPGEQVIVYITVDRAMKMMRVADAMERMDLGEYQQGQEKGASEPLGPRPGSTYAAMVEKAESAKRVADELTAVSERIPDQQDVDLDAALDMLAKGSDRTARRGRGRALRSRKRKAKAT